MSVHLGKEFFCWGVIGGDNLGGHFRRRGTVLWGVILVDHFKGVEAYFSVSQFKGGGNLRGGLLLGGSF